MDRITEFQEEHPSLESYWRSIILFGRNVASYKFALAEALAEIAPTGRSSITLDELAEPYSKYLCAHLKTAPKQATSNSSKFIQACKDYNAGNITHDQLIAVTVSLGFNNVIDAFHHVNGGVLPVKFYEKDYSGSSKRIILTDEIYRLRESPFSANLDAETESRWNLVETAWGLGVSRNLLNVKYDDESQLLVVDESYKRRDITSARGALNGYQKGKCFYCYDAFSLHSGDPDLCEIDHFFPYTLQRYMPDINLNGVWNLVLACQECNRGSKGKFAKVPAVKYLERLHKRNEFLINSHHPLRETIIRQTGATESERRSFLQEVDKRAISLLIHRWETEKRGPVTF